jgi:alpha-glucan phosphorylase-like protein
VNTLFNIAIHGHFYQPPREDPWTGTILRDPTAAPAHDWNERVCSECYRPNSAANILSANGRIASTINNYKYLSFNFGPTLHRWIEREDPALDETIKSCVSRAIAQCYNHMIMPLATARDKKTQIIWGIKDFEYRFGSEPKGMWLPETAADLETLDIMAAEGIQFTIMAPRQCLAVSDTGSWRETPNGNGLDVTVPYRCELPSGRSISIIFYHGGLAHDIAFGRLLDNGDNFKNALIAACREGSERLLVVATDGETYGHHHKFGEMALARAFFDLNSDENICLPAVADFLEQHPPIHECKIKENTSWSCEHGIERWRANCGCSTGGEPGWNQEWRAPLRSAFDALRDTIDEEFEKQTAVYCDGWKLRNNAIEFFRRGDLITKDEQIDFGKEFISSHLGNIDERSSLKLLALLEAQRMRMFMYTSCGWFFNDISGVETKQVIAYAVRAAQIMQEISGKPMMADLLAKLSEVKGNRQDTPDARTIVERNIIPYIEATDKYGKENNDNADFKAIPAKINARKHNKKGLDGMPLMNYGGNLARSLLETLERDPAFRSIAYFSMEIGLNQDIPTYSGGLGILAGDILKSSADLGVPMVGVTLLYKKGYFAQKINSEGRQTEQPVEWDPNVFLKQLPNKVTIDMHGRSVTIGVWTYMLTGESGHPLPIFFLDTDLSENTPEDRALTAELYGGDNEYRLCQELILGIGGLRLLRDMGFRNIDTFHLNEGHAGFITLELLREQGYGDIQKIKNQVIFTTHTPVAAGHDFFPYDLISKVIGNGGLTSILQRTVGGSGLSMTDLALKFSRYVNGVSRKHAEVSRKMFHDQDIDWVTNGVHSTTWTSDAFAKLYDKYIPGWRNDPSRLMQALLIPNQEIWNAHQTAKMKLLSMVLEETGLELDPDKLTIGFARRAATYKRADLVFSDIKKLLEIGAGKVQFVFSGKAHPHDEPGKDILQKICNISKELGVSIPVAFIENYNIGPAKMITSGVDLWLNTPVRPREASGTSGMKCVHNGVMNFSVLDGWWIEGCIEGRTGWAIGPEPKENDMDGYDESEDAVDLYRKLEEKIIPLYYNDRDKWTDMMKEAIAVNASYFNTHRVVKEYCEKAYGTVFRGH